MERLRIALLLLIACLCSASNGSNFACKEAERNTLLKLKHSFMDTQNILGSWVGGDCCSWKGVGCDNVTSQVIKLDLGGELGYGYLGTNEVNPALLELKHLRYLDLSGIYFNYSRFPQFLGSMGQLQYLNLSNVPFVGKVPQNLGNLTKLVVLDLSNSFSWYLTEMVTSSLEWAFKLENLQYLDMSWIDLSQALDSLHILNKLPSLSMLKMASCGLRNSHLSIGHSNISSINPIQHLDLHLNDLSGPFPSFIQNFSFIRFLDLSYNHLESSIPLWLANKRNLEFLSVSNNRFNRLEGGIVQAISCLCSLKHLDLSYNQIVEELSESYANFSRGREYNLEYLNLQKNIISGRLFAVRRLVYLQHLDLSYNKFNAVPTSLWGLSSLVYLDMSYNHLSGVLYQSSFANLSRLLSLHLSANSLNLVISPNWLPPFQLESLLISSCKLNTPFPQWIQTQKSIFELDLSDTGIFGPIPHNIGNTMPSLLSLRLANNAINGSIPRSLCKLVKLEVLDLQSNSLSGMIPECRVISQILVIVELSSNKLSGSIPNSVTNSTYLQLLRLSNNSLEGYLPLSLSHCQDLMVLDVSKNNLRGEIPLWTGDIFPVLQIFIIRENKFNGTIPPHLCSMLSLQIIDIASNRLAGKIPHCFGHFEGMGSFKNFSDFTASPPSPTLSSFAPAATTNPDELSPYPPSLGPVSFAPVPAFAYAGAPTMNPDEWSVVEVIKGEEREYTTVLHKLVNMDLSCNNLEGVVPIEITSLSLLISLNLSHNHLKGPIPKDIGKMKSLEALDLSFNNLSGSIPESISSLYSLSKMNLSFNRLQGPIPTGSQLQTLEDPSIYMGNLGLCGDPLPLCFKDRIAHPPTSVVLEDDEEEDNKHEKIRFYLVIMSGFATGFWGVIGVLIVKRRWRQAFFGLAEEIADWLYVRVGVTIARAKGGR